MNVSGTDLAGDTVIVPNAGDTATFNLSGSDALFELSAPAFGGDNVTINIADGGVWDGGGSAGMSTTTVNGSGGSWNNTATTFNGAKTRRRR